MKLFIYTKPIFGKAKCQESFTEYLTADQRPLTVLNITDCIAHLRK